MTAIKTVLLFLLTIHNAFADDILSRISAHIDKTKYTQGMFRQEKHLKFLTKPLLSDGTFTYDQSKGVIWKTQAPFASSLLINDSQMISGEGGQAIPPAFSRVFKTLLSGEFTRLSGDFGITGTDNGKSWQLKLVPKDELMKKIIAVIRVEGNQDIRVWELQETGGNLTRINFSHITHSDYLNKEQLADFERLSH
jgi:outer membrane lipoprotein-sorting protein